MNPERVGPRRALVIVARGLPLAYCGCFGNEWVRTKTLDRLADRGVCFDSHFSTTTDPRRARIAWSGDGSAQIEQLRAAGVAVHELRPKNDTDRPWSLLPLRRSAYELLEQIPPVAPALVTVETDALLPPWSPPPAWCDYYLESLADDEDEPHEPWTGPVPDAIASDDLDTYERLQGTFAAVVSAFDQSLAKFLAGCRRRGFGADAMIAVTSDLGYPLGVQGRVGWTRTDISESAVHLPLVMRLPGRANAGGRVSALTEPADLAPTFLSYFDIGDDSGLWPLLHDPAAPGRDHLVLRSADGRETAVRTADRLAIFSEQPTRLYLKPEDRWEVNDLAGKMDAEVQRLAAYAVTLAAS